MVMVLQEVAKHVVLGILPLGKNNHTFNSLFPGAESGSRARYGEASCLRAERKGDCLLQEDWRGYYEDSAWHD